MYYLKELKHVYHSINSKIDLIGYKEIPLDADLIHHYYSNLWYMMTYINDRDSKILPSVIDEINYINWLVSEYVFHFDCKVPYKELLEKFNYNYMIEPLPHNLNCEEPNGVLRTLTRMTEEISEFFELYFEYDQDILQPLPFFTQ